MSFRKRNIGIQRVPVQSSPTDVSTESNAAQAPTPAPAPVSAPTASGVRPSPLTGQATTSTGAYSLDSLLGGHAGLVLGCSLLVEESGTTDFAGALLRYYAAEGIVQSHTVHLVGAGEQWIKDLPGLVGAAEAAETQKQAKRDEQKMKIAWRYERLGQVDADRGSRGEEETSRYVEIARRPVLTASQSSPSVAQLPFRTQISKSKSNSNSSPWPFATRLTLQSVSRYLPKRVSITSPSLL
jgi:hypothetical protein